MVSDPVRLSLLDEEELDLNDPLRHLMHGGSAGSTRDHDEDHILPSQRPSVINEIAQLHFPTGSTDSDPPPIRVTLAVDASPGCGGVAWPAGEVLSRYLARKGPNHLKDKNVLELGSGTGLVGLVAGHLGAKVWITDQTALLEIMRRNTILNNLTQNVMVEELNWGAPTPEGIPRPDIILAADCVYFEPAFPLLVQTLSELSDPSTEILFCYKKRRKADKRFFLLLKKHFTWKEVDDDPDHETYKREAIGLLRLYQASKNPRKSA